MFLGGWYSGVLSSPTLEGGTPAPEDGGKPYTHSQVKIRPFKWTKQYGNLFGAASEDEVSHLEEGISVIIAGFKEDPECKRNKRLQSKKE